MRCVFCRIVAKQSPALIVYEDELTLAFLDKYPQSRGHLQLIPKKHYRWIYDIAEIEHFFTTARTITRGIIPALGTDHASWITFGTEIEHAHLWIVPRYTGGTVISEGKGTTTSQQAQISVQKLVLTALRGEVS